MARRKTLRTPVEVLEHIIDATEEWLADLREALAAYDPTNPRALERTQQRPWPVAEEEPEDGA